MNLNNGNFFTLTLQNGSNYISASNILAGQTTVLLLTTGVSSTVSFPSYIKQPSGSSYVPSGSSGNKDILTFVSFDASTLYVASTKNLI
jgi:hypothetical protein